MTMNILWISQNLPYPPKTGVLQRNYNLIRQASQFANVHLIAILKRDILPDYDAEVARRELAKLCQRVDVVELPTETSRLRLLWVAFKSLFTHAPFTSNWAQSSELRDTLSAALAREKFDVVFFDTISLAGYRSLVRGPATVLNHHNIESHLFERRVMYERNPLRRAYYAMEARKLARFEAEAVGQFDANVTVSSLDAQRLRELAPGLRTGVVANGVDVDYFREQAAEPDHGHLVMVSGMNWFPNKDAAIYMAREIWPLLARAFPQIRLTIVGASPPDEVRQLAETDQRVAVTGFVDDVRPYMDRAQIYLCPMRDGGGTRLKILDALSMGKPIVATTMAVEGIDVKSGEDVLLADTPQAFVEQIGRLLADASLRQRLSQNARRYVEANFAWPVIGERMAAIFSELARART